MNPVTSKLRYFIQESPTHPGHWNVLCDEGDPAELPAFSQAFNGPGAEKDAQELADYFNNGGY